jgi:hypothetical protein
VHPPQRDSVEALPVVVEAVKRLRQAPLQLIHLGVAVHVAFERRILKPVFHLIGARVETRRLSAMAAMGQGESTCAAPPQRAQT